MSQFYARYVPPSAAAPKSSPEPSKVEKRKRTTEDPSSKNRKRQKKVVGDDESQTAQTKASTDVQQIKEVEEADNVPTSTTVRSKTAASKDGASPQPVSEEGKTDAWTARKEKKKRKKERSPEAPVTDDDYTKKHGGMLSKFNKALAERPAPLDQVEDTPVKEQGEIHGLEPIPQPKVVDRPVQRPSFSVLPGWQADAVRVVHREAKTFSDFRIAKSTVKNLHKSGLETSFPIQTTVLPLLLEGADHHDGDVCVSAATGSGKTLAYVLPMIEDLKEYADTSLRGVIVVPTRELVQQVRQLCETCAAGSKLRIAVASGSKSMKDEQKLLVVEEERYDPQRWEQEQNAPIDWANFSIATFMQEARHRSRPTSTHFVKQHRSKVDILITTPGRLVDHLRSTAGFNLDHVKWLVVDEADRLLNESYQEWIDVVTPALQSQVATAERDRLLRHMRMEPPPRQVKKVLLSATMTRDISKLSSLGLVNPKLVVLGHPPSESHVEASKPGEDGLFHLPPSLTELVVPINDGHDKPLFLLEILQSRILASAGTEKTSANGTTSDDESDSSSSSSDSSSDSESDSDTDSASESSVTTSDSSASETSQPHEKPSAFIKPTPKHPKTTTTPSATRVLIFTRSTASTTRLSRLLSLLSPSLAAQISTLTKSTSSSASSRRALSSFRSGRTPILIATDRASRGLDIPNLEHVVSYDVPSSALTYVHRVGRTARAGRQGTAWTIVEHREGRWFWGEIGGKGKGKGQQQGEAVQRTNKVQKIQVEVDVEAWKEEYESALAKLGEEVKA